MPKFSTQSRNKLETCDQQLQDLFNEVIKHWDCTVVDGHRDEEKQTDYFLTGRSKVTYPNSKHNSYPSKGIDVCPYPIDWNDWNRFYAFAGYVQGTAQQMGINIRSGLDWDGDHDLKDQTFMDAPHFELI